MSSAIHQFNAPARVEASVHRMLGIAALGVSVAFASPAVAEGQAAEDLGAWYTAEQSERGARTFAANCGTCHGDEMLEYFAGYETVQAFYSYIESSMPVDNPGGLSRRSYIEITAYILSRAGFPDGDEPLTADRDLLEGIVPVVIDLEGEDEAGEAG